MIIKAEKVKMNEHWKRGRFFPFFLFLEIRCDKEKYEMKTSSQYRKTVGIKQTSGLKGNGYGVDIQVIVMEY